MANKDDFCLAKVSVVCRKHLADDAIEAMMSASNNLSVYGFEMGTRPLSAKEWAEVQKMTPGSILDDKV